VVDERKESVGLVDWTYPSEELKARVEREQGVDADERILKVIGEKGVSYPAEIVGLSGLSRQTVFDRLFRLKEEGRVRRVNTNVLSPPEKLKKRLPELWSLGLRGGQIRRMSWYELVEDDVDERRDVSGEVKES